MRVYPFFGIYKKAFYPTREEFKEFKVSKGGGGGGFLGEKTRHEMSPESEE